MQRRRHSTGYVRRQRGKWIGAWYVNGKRTSKSLGLVNDLTKGEAKEKLAELIKESQQRTDVTLFGPFVEGPYFDFYGRKWKPSTAENNKQRIKTHLVAAFNDRALTSFNRDELQDFLDSKAGLSFSVVDHLRWGLSGSWIGPLPSPVRRPGLRCPQARCSSRSGSALFLPHALS